MFPEYYDLVIRLKNDDPHFKYVYDKYKALHSKIAHLKRHKTTVSDLELQQLKKEKLFLKDQAYLMLQKANGEL